MGLLARFRSLATFSQQTPARSWATLGYRQHPRRPQSGNHTLQPSSIDIHQEGRGAQTRSRPVGHVIVEWDKEMPGCSNEAVCAKEMHSPKSRALGLQVIGNCIKFAVFLCFDSTSSSHSVGDRKDPRAAVVQPLLARRLRCPSLLSLPGLALGPLSLLFS